MNTTARTASAFVLGFVIGLAVSIMNGGGVAVSIAAAAVFGLLVGIVISILSWAFNYAEAKGYSGWLGFFLVLVLNILGVLLLLVLPARNLHVNG
jgi:uncharacterized membrane protein